jgi:hypothetical protein
VHFILQFLYLDHQVGDHAQVSTPSAATGWPEITMASTRLAMGFLLDVDHV